MANKMLLAWGDSWLIYRPTLLGKQSNLMSNLRANGFTDAPQSPFAQSGLELATMAARPATDPVYTMFEDLLNANNAPRAIVFSAGGNDCVKGHLRDFVKPKGAAGTDIDPVAWKAHLGVLRSHYVAILGKFKAIAESLGAPLPEVVVHGYDHPVADGRFFFGGPGNRAWLRGSLVIDMKYSETEATDIMRRLIDGLNGMLATLQGDATLGRVKHVDLRGTLRSTLGGGMSDAQWAQGGYKDAWENELHPTPRGFAELTRKVAAALTP